MKRKNRGQDKKYVSTKGNAREDKDYLKHMKEFDEDESACTLEDENECIKERIEKTRTQFDYSPEAQKLQKSQKSQNPKK